MAASKHMHLMRTKIPTRHWERMGEIAEELSEVRGRRVSASDIVRSAIADWILDYDTLSDLGAEDSAFIDADFSPDEEVIAG